MIEEALHDRGGSPIEEEALRESLRRGSPYSRRLSRRASGLGGGSP